LSPAFVILLCLLLGVAGFMERREAMR
jgi:hypothetical protein